jgi:Pyruvate/2-oxoacid:ferredoxin oxidoreductase delta subunit
MNRNKGGAPTFDCYWRSSLENWVRTKLLTTKMHLLYVVMYKNDVQRARNDADSEHDFSPWYFLSLPEIQYRKCYPVQAVWFYCSENCLGFQSFNVEHTSRSLIQKSVVCRNLISTVLVHLSYMIPKDTLSNYVGWNFWTVTRND